MAGDDAILRGEGIVGIAHHGQVVFRVAGADQNLSSKLLLQFPGRPGLGNALGVDIDDPGGCPEDFALFSELLPEHSLCFINAAALFFAAGEHVRQHGAAELTV